MTSFCRNVNSLWKCLRMKSKLSFSQNLLTILLIWWRHKFSDWIIWSATGIQWDQFWFIGSSYWRNCWLSQLLGSGITFIYIEFHTNLITGAPTLDGHIEQSTPSTIDNQKLIIIILHLMLETVEVDFNSKYNCRVFLLRNYRFQFHQFVFELIKWRIENILYQCFYFYSS